MSDLVTQFTRRVATDALLRCIRCQNGATTEPREVARTVASSIDRLDTASQLETLNWEPGRMILSRPLTKSPLEQRSTVQARNH